MKFIHVQREKDALSFIPNPRSYIFAQMIFVSFPDDVFNDFIELSGINTFCPHLLIHTKVEKYIKIFFKNRYRVESISLGMDEKDLNSPPFVLMGKGFYDIALNKSTPIESQFLATLEDAAHICNYAKDLLING